MRIFNPQTVLEAVQAKAVNGKVTVALSSPRATRWLSNDGRISPDPTSLVSSLQLDASDFKVMTGTNAMGEYQRVVVNNAGAWFDIIILKDNILTVEGWMHPRKVADLNVKAFGTVAEWAKPVTTTNPAPTKTYFHLVTVVDEKKQTWSAVIEARGVPVTQETVKARLPMATFFNDESEARDYINDRVMFFSELTSIKPACRGVAFDVIAA